MTEAHPDRHGRGSASEQQEAANYASEITDAYAVLRAPHLRAIHLLELLGAPLAEDTSSTLLNPEFLMQVMEIREDLEEFRDDPERLCSLRRANRASMRSVHIELGDAFAENDLDRARELTARLQYLQKIEAEIHAHTPVK